MEKIRAAWLRLRALVLRRRLDADLQEELAFHLAMREQQNRENGMNDLEAHQKARRRFGNATRVREQMRSVWTLTSIETWWADVRYAGRMLRKTPLMTAVVVLSLALGIGANTAIFNVLNAAMLKPLPVPEPDRLHLLTFTSNGFPDKVTEDIEGTANTVNGRFWSYSFPSYFFDELRAHGNSFDGIAGFAANSEKANIEYGGHAEAAEVQAVAGDFFDTLRIVPAYGRLLSASDDQTNSLPAAMVSYRFWRTHMGEDKQVAGKTLVVNGQSITVAGVLPRDFYGIDPGSSPDVFIPLAQHIRDNRLIYDFDIPQPKVWWIGIVVRLKPGVTAASARAEISVLFDQALHSQFPTLPRDTSTPALDVQPFARGLDELRTRFSTSLFLLMAMVGVVLLIACANVASLLLARATVRQREIAVRLSLGAARWRVIRQLLTESVLLALLGAAAGLLVARWATTAIMAMLATGRHPVQLAVHIDANVLLFTAAVALLCGILFGLAPALRVVGVDLFPVLKQGQSQVIHGGHRFLPGKVLIGGQIALCVLLLVTAGLLGRTLAHLHNVPLGFDQRNVISFQVQPGMNGYKGARLMSYYADLQRRIETLGGVEHVTQAQFGPIGAGGSTIVVTLPGFTDPKDPVPVARHTIGAGYFETLRIPLLQGRSIGEQDTSTAPAVAVVNRQLVRQYFKGNDPIGRRIEFGAKTHRRFATIVGVAGDVRNNNIRDEVPPTAYYSYLQEPQFAMTMTFLVRTSGDPRTVMNAIKGEAAEVDKTVPLLSLRTESEIIDDALVMERLLALLSTLFGGLALLLSAIGLYGTIGYSVVRRTNEIGVRMALGAGRGTILRMVLRETLIIVAAGLLLGTPLAWFATRLLRSQLFELSPHDPVAIASAAGAILLVTVVSGFLPARRASRVDPMIALRYE